jgi:hypothetical protein
MRFLGLALWCVLFANHVHEAKLHNATKHTSGDIGTAGIVANVFRENFFAAFWSSDARFNRYAMKFLLAG